jgi:hypothetical protein
VDFPDLGRPMMPSFIEFACLMVRDFYLKL